MLNAAGGDRELVARAQQGDRDAFNLLVIRYQDRIFNSVYRICGHHEDACDIVQRAFINAFNNLAEFKNEAAFSTWMYRIAFNQAVSYRREQGRRRPVSIYGKEEDLIAEPAFEQNHSEAIEAEEAHRQIQKALLLLDEEDRTIIVLKDVEDRSYEEIADILKVPKGTVRSRLHRARQALREKARGFLGTPSPP